MLTRFSGRERHSDILSVNPGILPPPPTTKTALTEFPPLSSMIFSETFSTIRRIASSVVSRSSSYPTLYASPIIFLKDTIFFLAAAFFIFSAISKSTRNSRAMASVISSPARGIMPKAMILPSFTMEISEVPAPTSTSAIFSRRKRSGMAILIAAIGSSVRLATCSPASSTAE